MELLSHPPTLFLYIAVWNIFLFPAWLLGILVSFSQACRLYFWDTNWSRFITIIILFLLSTEMVNLFTIAAICHLCFYCTSARPVTCVRCHCQVYKWKTTSFHPGGANELYFFFFLLGYLWEWIDFSCYTQSDSSWPFFKMYCNRVQFSIFKGLNILFTGQTSSLAAVSLLKAWNVCFLWRFFWRGSQPWGKYSTCQCLICMFCKWWDLSICAAQ